MTVTFAKTARSTNRMTQPDFFRAARWVEENQASLKGLTQPKAAEAVAAGTGLRITAANIQAMADATGIALGKIIREKGGKSSSKDTIRTLARSLAHLYTGLGKAVPESLQAIAAR